MGKGSGRRPSAISAAELEKAWNSIFAGHPTQGIESDKRHNWARMTRVHVPRPQGDRISNHPAYLPLRIRTFWYFQARRVFGNVI